eukprot:GFKZ01013155.1.p1 GENE.GFKZ01013155.1~~GFKZ01013155.1.p1  ORF type:complete len:155 (+),score=14.06 GFKZ01013155.1:230-694(+)
MTLTASLAASLLRYPAPLSRATPSRTLSAITPDSKCVGCEGIGTTLTPAEVQTQRSLLIPQWETNEQCTRLTRSLRTKDFATAVEYVNRIAAIAEAEGHHPDLTIRKWNCVHVSLWTHSLGGLTDNDLIMAVKIDTIPVELAQNDGRRGKSEGS